MVRIKVELHWYGQVKPPQVMAWAVEIKLDIRQCNYILELITITMVRLPFLTI